MPDDPDLGISEVIFVHKKRVGSDDPVLGRIIRTAPVTGKTGGTGFQIPVAPILACSTQLGAPRPERKKGGLRKVEGDAVMLTPCSVGVAKAGKQRSTHEAKLQAPHR